jgi:type II secretory pathway component HofQ
VRAVLNVIADFTDLNIITSDTVGNSAASQGRALGSGRDHPDARPRQLCSGNVI